jgi:beta-glucosidase
VELLVAVATRTGLPRVVTVTGAAFDDAVLAAEGSGAAAERIAYRREHVAAVVRARDAGAHVRAYVAWTLLDNFEWAEGYTKKFGLVRVDPEDQTRTPKASYHWYAQLAHAGSLRPET